MMIKECLKEEIRAAKLMLKDAAEEHNFIRYLSLIFTETYYLYLCFIEMPLARKLDKLEAKLKEKERKRI